MPTSEPASGAPRPPLPAPRDAAQGAMVYRRRLREKPRESALRIAAWVGTILIHLIMLLGLVLGPEYEPLPFAPPPPPDEAEQALQVRLLDREPPRPVVKGEAARAAPVKSSASSPAANRRTRVVRSSPQPPAATPDAASVAVKVAPAVAAAKPGTKPVPRAPRKPPTAPPPTDLPKVPQPDVAPPDFAVNAPLDKPMPPKLQPVPVRKPQDEGNQPMPPPPSLEMPPIPVAQSRVRPEPPTMTASTTVDRPSSSIAPASVPRAEITETQVPPSKALAPVPDVAAAPVAPTVDAAAPRPTATIDVTPASVPQPAPAEEPELAAVDVTAEPMPKIAAPTSRLERTAVQTSILAPAAIPRAQLDGVGEPVPNPAPGDARAAGDDATPAPPSGTGDTRASLAATPTPGIPDGRVDAAADQGAAGKAGTNGEQPGAATGMASGGPIGAARGAAKGTTGGNGHADGGASGKPSGKAGEYIQLRPRGDTTVMSHDDNRLKYHATRFAGDWTPEGESSIDTALRHAVEKTTVSHTFNLPRGIRIKCIAMPLLPMVVMSCGNGDPPPKAVDPKVYKTMAIAPANPLVSGLGPAAAATAASPMPLDNASLCATARVAGGPLPPECAVDRVVHPIPKPGDSWVPASDQFH